MKQSKERMYLPPKNHNPKHKYDCENCKFNWCCGFTCSCIIYNVSEPPSDSLYKNIEKYNL